MSISSIRSTWPWITSEISPPLIHIWELANLLEAPNPGGRVATCVPMCISKDVCRPARALGGEVQKLLPACLPGTLWLKIWLKISRDILIENWQRHFDWKLVCSPRPPHMVGLRQGCLSPQRWHPSHPWHKITWSSLTKKKAEKYISWNISIQIFVFIHLKQECDDRDAKTSWGRIHYLFGITVKVSHIWKLINRKSL